MNILSIETSCDDTSIAIINISKKKGEIFDVLSNIISSQIKVHKKWGGVVPMLAKREHQKNLVPVLLRALKKANLLEIKKQKIIEDKTFDKILEREEELKKKLKKLLEKYEKPKIDFISVTVGPGLEPCLWTGLNLAKALSYIWNIKIIPVNHIEGHIYAHLLEEQKEKIQFPAIALIVSGGHTQIILVKEFGKYKIIGETRDDAAGECFDKTAKIMGLEYPGGPIISQKAKNDKGKIKIELPRPMINQDNYEFSFSGLKTAVLYLVKELTKKRKLTEQEISAISNEVQQSIIDVLIKKTFRAIKKYKIKSLIIGGGVSANEELRKQFKEKAKKENLKIFFPKRIFSTDNAAMIGVAGYFNQKKGRIKEWKQIKVNANLRIK